MNKVVFEVDSTPTGKCETLSPEKLHENQREAFRKNDIPSACRIAWSALTKSRHLWSAISAHLLRTDPMERIEYLREVLGIKKSTVAWTAAMYRIFAGIGKFDEEMAKASEYNPKKSSEVNLIGEEIKKLATRETCVVYFALARMQ